VKITFTKAFSGSLWSRELQCFLAFIYFGAVGLILIENGWLKPVIANVCWLAQPHLPSVLQGQAGEQSLL
jgi:hypothetical protein